MEHAGPLVRTKLHFPFVRPLLVDRPRLNQLIEQGLQGPFTLVSGPAGYGKSTLIASYFRNHKTQIAWLSLDKDDNREGQFLRYLVAAIHEANTTIGTEALQLMTAPQPAITHSVLISLINDLDASDKPVTLVLDDYHLIAQATVHEAITFLINHCPPTFHLIIVTRSDPPLPLARLRARGQVVEVRVGDLQFNTHEAQELLNQSMGLTLDSESINVITERTEGWAVGLQMAALSLRNHSDQHEFIQKFSGTNRYILDYLLEEVLDRQSPSIQQFLLKTSILERLHPELCAALITYDEIGPPDISHAQSLLAQLERNNLFLIPLDDERRWYRYHHLFADLLRNHLMHTVVEDDVLWLHKRAGRWYERHGWTYEAIYHASMAGDDDWMERLIEQNYTQMMQQSESLAVRFWSGMLSSELILKRPLICIHEAMSRAWFGQLDAAQIYLDHAEKYLRKNNSTPKTTFLLGYAAYVRSRMVAMRGDIDQAISIALEAQNHIPPDSHVLQSGILMLLGYANYLRGDFGQAKQLLSETIERGLQVTAITTTSAAYCVMARLKAIQGDLPGAFDLYQTALQIVQGVDGQHAGALSIIAMGLAGVYLEWNEIDLARSHIMDCLQNIHQWNKVDDIAMAYVIRSRTETAEGNFNTAESTIEKAYQLIRSSGVFCEVTQEVISTRIRLQLAQGQISEAKQWANTVASDSEATVCCKFQCEMEYMTLARLHLAENKFDDALEILNMLDGTTRSEQRYGRLTEALMLKAEVLYGMKMFLKAIDTLSECLSLAKTAKRIRIFLDEGKHMHDLLALWCANTDDNNITQFGYQILASFEEQQTQHQKAKQSSPNDSLVEPLSERELEILSVIAEGKTNRDIARELIIALGTVKAHTASIYRKLDVANRTEAVARARQLGLLQ